MATTYYTLKPGHLRTFLLGVARRPGELVPVPPPESLGAYDRQALEAHFERAGGGADAGGADAPPVLRNGLTEEQARAKLRAAGVPGVDDIHGDALADLCDRAFAPPGGGREPPALTDADGPDGASGGPDDDPGADREPPAKQQQRKNK
jgi:hypothetical protein